MKFSFSVENKKKVGNENTHRDIQIEALEIKNKQCIKKLIEHAKSHNMHVLSAQIINKNKIKCIKIKASSFFVDGVNILDNITK